MAKPVLVEVEWQDARSVYKDIRLEKVPDKCLLVHRFTTGYLILKDRERMIIANTYDPADQHDDESAADFTVIPRGWVKNVVFLAPVKKEEGEE